MAKTKSTTPSPYEGTLKSLKDLGKRKPRRKDLRPLGRIKLLVQAHFSKVVQGLPGEYCHEMANAEGLLAKWRLDKEGYGFEPARGFYYHEHLTEVLWGWSVLFNVEEKDELRYINGDTGRWHDSYAHALYHTMGLKDRNRMSFDEFRRWSLLSVLGHDLGKSGGEFQQMLWSMEVQFRKLEGSWQDKREKMGEALRHHQLYRHEYLSGILMMRHPGIKDWFLKAAGSQKGFYYAVAGAMGHHLKATKEKAVRYGKAEDLKERRDKVWSRPIYIQGLRQATNQAIRDTPWIAKEGITEFLPKTSADGKQGWGDMTLDELGVKRIGDLSSFLEQAEESLKNELGEEYGESPETAIIKFITILSDVLGSISQERDPDTLEWERPGVETRERLEKALHLVFRGPQGTNGIDYEGRLKDLGVTSLHDFQKECRDKKAYHAILEACTGIGKTVGALARSTQFPFRRTIFAGSTTDTVASLAMDYGRSDTDATRVSTKRVPLPSVSLTSTPECDKKEDARNRDEDRVIERNFRNFDADVTFATVDQILGCMTYYHKSVMWLLYLPSTQIVFDECHSYTGSLGGYYFQFLEWFPNIPTTHLSATIRKSLLDKITETLSQEPARILIPGDNTPKYDIEYREGTPEKEEFGEGYFWMTNTVQECQGIASEYGIRDTDIVYHSRFMKWKKDEIRDKVKDTFGKENHQDACLRVIGTQVMEMSLDVSCKGLILQLRPWEGIIQALGRAARFVEGPVKVKVIIYFPKDRLLNGFPYSPKKKDWEEDYAPWEDFAKALVEKREELGRSLSQKDVTDLFHKHTEDLDTGQGNTSSLDETFLRTSRTDLRDRSYTTDVFLESKKEEMERIPPYKLNDWKVSAILTKDQRREFRHGMGRYKGMRSTYVLNDDGSTHEYDDWVGLVSVKGRKDWENAFDGEPSSE